MQTKKPKIMAMLSYVGMFCVLPFLFDSKDKFTMNHAKQGVALFASEVLLYLLIIIPFLGWVAATIGIFLAILFSITGIVRAYSGEEWRVPFIGKYAEKINF